MGYILRGNIATKNRKDDLSDGLNPFLIRQFTVFEKNFHYLKIGHLRLNVAHYLACFLNSNQQF
jgi:hypothetical protein